MFSADVVRMREWMMSSFDIIVKGLLERADDGGLSWLHLPVAAACRALTAELSNLHFFESLLQSVIEQCE